MCHNTPRIGYKIPYNSSIETKRLNETKSLHNDVQYSLIDRLWKNILVR
jgi:hypothetical protein